MSPTASRKQQRDVEQRIALAAAARAETHAPATPSTLVPDAVGRGRKSQHAPPPPPPIEHEGLELDSPRSAASPHSPSSPKRRSSIERFEPDGFQQLKQDFAVHHRAEEEANAQSLRDAKSKTAQRKAEYAAAAAAAAANDEEELASPHSRQPRLTPTLSFKVKNSKLGKAVRPMHMLGAKQQLSLSSLPLPPPVHGAKSLDASLDTQAEQANDEEKEDKDEDDDDDDDEPVLTASPSRRINIFNPASAPVRPPLLSYKYTTAFEDPEVLYIHATESKQEAAFPLPIYPLPFLLFTACPEPALELAIPVPTSAIHSLCSPRTVSCSCPPTTAGADPRDRAWAGGQACGAH